MSDCLTEDEVLAYMAGQGDGRALLDHIETCARCRSLVASAAEHGESSVWHPSTAGPRETTVKTGAMVAGRYEIIRFLGRGGMGEVYEARDKELGDLVALKTLAMTTLDDADAVNRLKAEVLLARRVAHPNVCRIFDFGVHESRRVGRDAERLPFLTMELLSGQTLGQRLRAQGPMRSAEARTVVAQVVAGLAEVHRVGIVHRDFKSDNVFLAKSEVGERVVLMDFGLARTAPRPDRASTSLFHGLVGTVAYMSPEQIEHKRLGPPSDIYALGVVMYEMMTGRLPFTGTSVFEVALARLRRLPPSPSTVKPGVPREWSRAIMRCLAIDPEARFGRATDILVALDSGQHGRSTRWRVVAACGVVAVLIAVAALWLPGSQHRGARGILPAAEVAPVAVSRPSTVRVPPASLPPPAGLRSAFETRDQPPPEPVQASQNGTVQRRFPPMASAPRRRRIDRSQPASPASDPGAAEATTILPTPGQVARDDSTQLGASSGASGQGGAREAQPVKNPADRIVNPFAPKVSVP